MHAVLPFKEVIFARCLTVSLISETEKASLVEIVGNEQAFVELSELDIVILLLALKQGKINNTSIQQHSDSHPRDIGDRLGYMVKKKWLSQFGKGPATTYKVYREEILDLFDHETTNSQHYEDNSQHYEDNSQHYEELERIAQPVRTKGRVDKWMVKNTIIQLCMQEALSVKQLSKLLDRTPESLSNHYLRGMIKEGLIELTVPDNLNSPNQAYKAKK